jgi:hypothetical protein
VKSGNSAIPHDGTITVSFADQASRNDMGYSSHDCEALFALADSLYLFTKNWTNASTSAYVLPSNPGHYLLKPRVSYNTGMLVSGADLNRKKKRVALVGYRQNIPVVIHYGFENDPAQISCVSKARIYPLLAGSQVEGICFDPSGDLWFSSEKGLRKQKLFKLRGTFH